ncbi:hypothetical protein MASR2M64_07820 [Candidatus Cloacimonadota bacterium]
MADGILANKFVTEALLAENTVLLSLNVEPKNALNTEAIQSLISAFDRCEQNAGVDIICITGHDRAFCTGLNLDTMIEQTDDEAIRMLYLFDILLYRLLRSNKLIISAINGHAVGSGAILALATDYRLINSNDKIKIGFPEYPKGITLPALMRDILKRAGLNNARMLLLGELVTPQRAEQLGMVDEVCDCDVLVCLEEMCTKLNTGNFSYREYKQHFVMQDGFHMPQPDDPEYASIVVKVFAQAQRLSNDQS